MAGDVMGFSWRVSPGGYRWERGEQVDQNAPKGDGLFLTDGLRLFPMGLLGTEVDMNVYHPLWDEPELYRLFAALDAKDRSVLAAFAGKYGLLKEGVTVRLLDITEQEKTPFWDVKGESWDFWRRQIEAMRVALSVWDQLRARDLSSLGRHISYRPGRSNLDPGQWVFDSHPGAAPTARTHGRVVTPIPPPMPGMFEPGDVILPATFLLQRWVNERLRGRISKRIIFDQRDRCQVMVEGPDDLLTAMWLQLGSHMVGNAVGTGIRKQQPCKECGKPFDVVPGGDGRKGKRVFCSVACKTKDYRRRKDRALVMSGQRKTVEQIAEATSTEPATVRKWVGKKGRG